MIQDLTPIIYEHLCVFYKLDEPTKIECLENLEEYLKVKLMPERQYVFYMTGVVIDEIDLENKNDDYNEQLQEAIEIATPEWIKEQISQKLYEEVEI